MLLTLVRSQNSKQRVGTTAPLLVRYGVETARWYRSVVDPVTGVVDVVVVVVVLVDVVVTVDVLVEVVVVVSVTVMVVLLVMVVVVRVVVVVVDVVDVEAFLPQGQLQLMHACV